MTLPRSKQVDASVTRWYHCISRCVRQAYLLDGGSGQGRASRKLWIEHRLRTLSEIFSISIGGFSVMDNHLHVLVRLDAEIAEAWSDEEVARRWLKLYPPRDSQRRPLKVTPKLIDTLIQDTDWVDRVRLRLSSLSWFMKCLKEPLARMVNKAEQCTGAFWSSRYKSIAILDEEALLSVCAYIDLNPVAAGISPVPEASPNTSIKQRVEHVRRRGREAEVAVSQCGSVLGSRAAQSVEDSLWLVPIEDRRRLDSPREGMIEGFTLGNYLALVEYTGRLLREGKASISSELADIFDRLHSSIDDWQNRLLQLCGKPTLGRFLATSRARLKAAALAVGAHRLKNLNGCEAL